MCAVRARPGVTQGAVRRGSRTVVPSMVLEPQAFLPTLLTIAEEVRC